MSSAKIGTAHAETELDVASATQTITTGKFMGKISESIQTSRNKSDRQNLDGDRLGKAGSLRTPTGKSYAESFLRSTRLSQSLGSVSQLSQLGTGIRFLQCP